MILIIITTTTVEDERVVMAFVIRSDSTQKLVITRHLRLTMAPVVRRVKSWEYQILIPDT